MKATIGISLVLMAALTLCGCTPQPASSPSGTRELGQAILELGPGIDSAEAARAASIAHDYSLQLAQEYRITDPPVIHNARVKNGLRDRGLSNHFAEDIRKRMDQEGFRTLELHWAASLPKTFQIPHYTAVISRRGDTVKDGIVLDPWRHGGILYWSRTGADDKYDWAPLLEAREAY